MRDHFKAFILAAERVSEFATEFTGSDRAASATGGGDASGGAADAAGDDDDDDDDNNNNAMSSAEAAAAAVAAVARERKAADGDGDGDGGGGGRGGGNGGRKGAVSAATGAATGHELSELHHRVEKRAARANVLASAAFQPLLTRHASSRLLHGARALLRSLGRRAAPRGRASGRSYALFAVKEETPRPHPTPPDATHYCHHLCNPRRARSSTCQRRAHV